MAQMTVPRDQDDFKAFYKLTMEPDMSAETERQERIDMEVNRLRAAVDALADAMKAKLYKKARQGFSGWDDGCTDEELLDMARTHLNRIEQGDPFQDVDVANFMAFLFARRSKTADQ